MKKEKEQALPEFLDMIRRSWTWQRLTEEEKARFLDELDAGPSSAAGKSLGGTFEKRWYTLQAFYQFFLAGTGYRPDGWREPADADPAPNF